MNDDNFASAEQLLRDDNRSNCLYRATTCVTDDMRITLYQTQGFCRVDPSIHARNDSHLTIEKNRWRLISTRESTVGKLVCAPNRHI